MNGCVRYWCCRNDSKSGWHKGFPEWHSVLAAAGGEYAELAKIPAAWPFEEDKAQDISDILRHSCNDRQDA